MKTFLIVLSAVVFLAGPAQAATFDVTTADQLQTALTTAQNNGQDDLIRVAESNDPYTRAGCFTHTPAATENFALVIQGGWNPSFTYVPTTPTTPS